MMMQTRSTFVQQQHVLARLALKPYSIPALCTRHSVRTPARSLGPQAEAAVADETAVAAAGAPQQQAAVTSRRQLLRGIAAATLLTSTTAAAVTAAAADELGFDLEKQLPGVPQPGPELPKAYQRTMHKLVKALRDTIETEAAGAKEFEVRRKADGAKDLVKEFVGKWQDNVTVVGDVTHTEMKDAISELGRFYQTKGPRARLDAVTRDNILAHLTAVEAALPEEEKSLLGF